MRNTKPDEPVRSLVTFGERVKWLKSSRDLTWDEVAREMSRIPPARDKPYAGNSVKQWGTFKEGKVEEEMVIRFCAVFSAAPEWLRYAVGAPFRDTWLPGDDASFDLVMEAVEQMGSMPAEEQVAEFYRRAVRRGWGPKELAKVNRWVESHLGLKQDDDSRRRKGSSRPS